MNNINIFVYLLICPINLIHVFDIPSSLFQLRNKTDKTFTYGWHEGGEVQTGSGSHTEYDEIYMLELAKVYYQIVLKNKKDIRRGQEENYDLVISSFEKKDHVGEEEKISLRTVHVKMENIHLLYKHVENKSFIEIKIKKNHVINYINLFRNSYCIYKLNANDYNLMKSSSDHTKSIMISSYYTYILIALFSMFIYVEKSLLIEFPVLKKYEILLTLFVIFVPIIMYLFLFYYYLSVEQVILIYILFYALFTILHNKRKNIIIRKNGEKNIRTVGNTDNTSDREINSPYETRNKSLIHMRLTNMCITYICIFAVDFFFFPRKFKKSAFYGNTLMDLGIGSCITSSAYSINKKKLFKSIQKKKSIIDLKYFILFFLGIARFVAITLFSYNYNITEYGHHWNFFLTLFFSFLISNIIFHITKSIRNIFLLSCFSIVLYEIFIYYFNIKSYLLDYDTQRINFFSKNREGIFNTIGSINLYLFSFSIWNGFVLQDETVAPVSTCQNDQTCSSNEPTIEENRHPMGTNSTLAISYSHHFCPSSSYFPYYYRFYYSHFSAYLENYFLVSRMNQCKIYFNLKLFALSMFFYVLHKILNFYENYSVRILCNANYIFISSSVSLFACGLSYLVEALLLGEKTTVTILDKINKNSLLIFLFCNIIMGVFNLLFQSLLYPFLFAFIILVIYTFLMLQFASIMPIVPKKEKEE
ncbi:GPI-anchored wall transfer protein 1 [Plasmodium gonderi]|uniref:GPI-anchored wall transfer protein 1 n=1 Tax=Plasmodium gonderi TaxID=77519 RepID=A0A1Y1JI07_PLAGO|nr:GPI-anchored wall transfer protein 1 [Plasmodium gonderi]GAW81870.1 GPI-anchored wall transfer protein 1 [Plasmodium gonderi]